MGIKVDNEKINLVDDRVDNLGITICDLMCLATRQRIYLSRPDSIY